MSIFRALARAYVVDRMMRGGRRPHRRSRWGAPPPSPWYAPPRPRQRSGFGFFGPFPTYSTRTRRGSHVSVSGCCLPIPLTFALGGVLAARRLHRR